MLRRRIMKQNQEEFVDLELPSGLKWCTHNIGGTNPEDYGYYFSWGNVEGFKKGTNFQFRTHYSQTPGSKLTGDIPVGDTYDIARKVMGSPWRLPTSQEFEELYRETDRDWVSNYNGTGVAGLKCMKKSDHSVYIFLPACGRYDNNKLDQEGKSGFFWSSTYSGSSVAIGSYFTSYSSEGDFATNRYWGFSGRAVQ